VPGWSLSQIATLRNLVSAAPEDALPVLPTTALDRAMIDAEKPDADKSATDRAATALALRLARMELLGNTPPAERLGWHVVDTDASIDLPARLAQALGTTATAPAGPDAALDRFFAGLKPEHPNYAALRTAYATEQDPARHATLALNMERWRWLPQSLGQDYVLVNVAAFEVSLWRQGHQVGIWPIVDGKPKSPTPEFSATITGVTLNPWWDVPANIVRESIGRMMSRHPALARQRGYVRQGARYRQRPGPANSLGQMKLAMPNPFDVYLHDTPEKQLFAKESRAFSHGCMRVGDALGFATTLLQGVKTREEVDAILASGQSPTIPLAAALPVFVTYFTVHPGQDGALVFSPDVYHRDGGGK
jgi:murein L,D-transpeptidase YcbB/YkuD